MKKIQLFTFSYFLFFVLFTSFVFAQSTVDLNGTFEGLRKQYDPSHNYFSQEFEYRYTLVQDGNQVNGTSTIYSESGDYADVKIRGMVIGNKFYFEEYEIIDEIKAPYSVWCYKSGELDIIYKDGKTYLKGKTKSFMSNYGAACSGGYTEIVRTSGKQDPCFGDCDKEANANNLKVNINLYPNPTANFADITYDVSQKSNVAVEVFDLSGRLISTPVNKVLDKGTYSSKVNLEKESTGLFIVKLTIGEQVYSKELIKAAK
jgi:hypothetical protein